jgi:hypothetical protein
MKKFFVILVSILVIFILALFSVPFLFKDKIRSAVNDAINNNVNAKVYFDANQFDLTFFSKFPNLTVSLGDFGVVGINEFEGDTLANIKSFNLTIDLISLFGDNIKVKGVTLNSPTIKAIVLPNGIANWNIAKLSNDTSKSVEQPKGKSTFSLGIDRWEIINANIIYDDRKTPQFAQMENLNHKGKGNITQDVYDLNTETSIDYFTYRLDSIAYLTKKRIEANVVLTIDNPNAKYTFKDNEFKINDFSLGFNGFVTLPQQGVYVDVSFESQKTDFKNILSLVPGIYSEGFKDITTEGKFSFAGFAKGWQKEGSIPSFGINVKVEDGLFQYPKLPTAVSNIFLDIKASNADGVLDHTIVNLTKFHLDLGKNPIDGHLRVEGLTDYALDGELKAKVDLKEISSIFPLNGLNLKGLLGVDIFTKGTYSKAGKLMPRIKAGISLTNGYVKSDKFPAPIEKIELLASANNPSGLLNDTKVKVPKLNFELEGEPFATSMALSNFNDLIYDIKAKGKIDLDKVTKIYPLERISLRGIIDANIETKGKLSDVQAGKYINCPTSGTLAFNNFIYVGSSFSKGLKITAANFVLSPDRINISNLSGSVGKSDIRMNGYIANYLQYAFVNGTLKGNVDFTSSNFNADEWTESDEREKESELSTKNAPSTVYEVPKNLDFTLNSNIGNLIYSNYGITNFTGSVVIRDGILSLNNLLFNMIDGKFNTNGIYNTKDINHPLFDFSLAADKISIQKALTTFSVLKAYVKDPNTIQGTVSSNIKINGELGKDNKPINQTVYGRGLINVLEASINNKLLSGLADATKISELKQLKLNNTQIQGEIKNGRLYLSPFDVNAGNVKSNISGSQGLDGTLDYLVKLDVPTGQLGTAVSGAIAKFSGYNIGNVGRVNVNFKVSGTSEKPILTPTGVTPNGKNQIVNAQVEDQVKQVEQQVQQQVKQEIQQQLANPNPADAEKKLDDATQKLKKQFKFP